MQLGSFSKHEDNPTPALVENIALAARSAEDQLQSGSANVQSSLHIDAVVPLSSNPGLTTQPQPAIGHYDAVSTFHDDDFCEACLPMPCSSCLELNRTLFGPSASEVMMVLCKYVYYYYYKFTGLCQ